MVNKIDCHIKNVTGKLCRQLLVWVHINSRRPRLRRISQRSGFNEMSHVCRLTATPDDI